MQVKQYAFERKNMLYKIYLSDRDFSVFMKIWHKLILVELSLLLKM